jgi:hypothetical protein
MCTTWQGAISTLLRFPHVLHIANIIGCIYFPLELQDIY